MLLMRRCRRFPTGAGLPWSMIVKKFRARAPKDQCLGAVVIVVELLHRSEAPDTTRHMTKDPNFTAPGNVHEFMY